MKKGKTVIQKPLEARKASPLLVSLSAVFLGIVAGCFFILCIGKNPLAGFEKILVCELNNGQFANYLRGLLPQFSYLQYNKVQGQPFLVHELAAAIDKEF